MSQVAVFIDFENLVLGAEATLPGTVNPVPYAALDLLTRDFGNAAIRRAYADWSVPSFGRFQEDLGLNGVDLIQVKRFGVQQKNAADIRMAVDAMETLIVHPEVEVFLLVAGDGDYTPLVQKLREFGKLVVGVGTEASASKRLVSVCSEYKYWASLVAAVDRNARSAVAAEFDLGDVQPLVRAALASSNTQPTQASWLKHRMLILDPAFDGRNYGLASFRDFLNALGYLHVQSEGNDLVVTLRDQSGVNGAANETARTAAPDIMRLLRQRGMELPASPETRDELLGKVHDAWCAGRLQRVSDVGDVLRDAETGYVPNAKTRGPLRHALVWDGRLLRVRQQPTQDRRLGECALWPWDGSSSADWIGRAHVAWLTMACRRLSDQESLLQTLSEVLFAEAHSYGQELLGAALAEVSEREASGVS